jgi:hypothetical protein
VALCFELLAKDPKQRPKDAKEVIHRVEEELGRLVADEEVLGVDEYLATYFDDTEILTRRRLAEAVHKGLAIAERDSSPGRAAPGREVVGTEDHDQQLSGRPSDVAPQRPALLRDPRQRPAVALATGLLVLGTLAGVALSRTGAGAPASPDRGGETEQGQAPSSEQGQAPSTVATRDDSAVARSSSDVVPDLPDQGPRRTPARRKLADRRQGTRVEDGQRNAQDARGSTDAPGSQVDPAQDSAEKTELDAPAESRSRRSRRASKTTKARQRSTSGSRHRMRRAPTNTRRPPEDRSHSGESTSSNEEEIWSW